MQRDFRDQRRKHIDPDERPMKKPGERMKRKQLRGGSTKEADETNDGRRNSKFFLGRRDSASRRPYRRTATSIAHVIVGICTLLPENLFGKAKSLNPTTSHLRASPSVCPSPSPP